MKPTKLQNQRVARRQARTRSKIRGTAAMPRLSVKRGNRNIFLQAIDDVKGVTLVSASTKELDLKGTKSEKAMKLGELIAEKAKKIGVSKMVFDRGAYKYHGRVKNVAEGARKGGLEI
ncbi:MAG TPA: 50S ribosomal protein L18 [Candidatus Colwellbacteria bacterium]|jgi:large subunit ribosomal protein L18|nr:50S ribosomal protein L18 [Candidatus Colwellbacteria bacterium]